VHFNTCCILLSYCCNCLYVPLYLLESSVGSMICYKLLQAETVVVLNRAKERDLEILQSVLSGSPEYKA